MKVLYYTTVNLDRGDASGLLKCYRRNYKFLSTVTDDIEVKNFYLDDEEFITEDNHYGYAREEDRLKKLYLSLKGKRFMMPETEKRIIEQSIAENPDILFFDGPFFADIMAVLRKKLPQCRIILFMQNIEKMYYGQLKDKGIQMKLLYRVACRCERKSVELADQVICLNSRDDQVMMKEYGRKSDLILPITFSDCFDANKVNLKHSNKEILFVGSLFPANYDGIVWFVDNVMSQLKDYKLTIVGKNFETVAKDLERENVHVVGSVENLEEYYYAFPMMVMPILYGGGMKVKTAESMMYGKTILATEEALVGYDATGVEGIYECNTAEEFVTTIQRLYESGLPEVQDMVRTHFLEKYESEKLRTDFNQFMLEMKDIKG